MLRDRYNGYRYYYNCDHDLCIILVVSKPLLFYVFYFVIVIISCNNKFNIIMIISTSVITIKPGKKYNSC